MVHPVGIGGGFNSNEEWVSGCVLTHGRDGKPNAPEGVIARGPGWYASPPPSRGRPSPAPPAQRSAPSSPPPASTYPLSQEVEEVAEADPSLWGNGGDQVYTYAGRIPDSTALPHRTAEAMAADEEVIMAFVEQEQAAQAQAQGREEQSFLDCVEQSPPCSGIAHA